MKTSALSKARPRWDGITWLVIMFGLALATAKAQDRSLNPQYGFMHRVNTGVYIDDALGCDNANPTGNPRGIEFDVSYNKNGVFNNRGPWCVIHDWSSIISTTPTLHEWLQDLKTALDTGSYDTTFCALFVDVKTPHNGLVTDVVDIIRQYVTNTNVAVIYCLQDVTYFTSVNGAYEAIRNHGLRANEGFSCWISHASEFVTYSQKMHDEHMTNWIADVGDDTGLCTACLNEINKTVYHNVLDPYRIKKVLSWTQQTPWSMKDCVNPANSYHSDAQLVGYQAIEWDPSALCYTRLFRDAVSDYSSSQRVAVRSDFASFWDRSGSDYVDGSLIHVNNDMNVTLGGRQTGTKWEPYTNLVGAASASQSGAINIVHPGTYHNGVARIAKPLRLVKSADVGVARLTN